MSFQSPAWLRTWAVLLVFFGLGRCLALGPGLIAPEADAPDLPSEVSFSWEVGPLTNLVVNGGFESGVSGWFGNVGSVGNPASNGRLMAVRNAAAAAEGTYYGSMTAAAGIRNLDIFVFQQIAIPNIPSTVRLSWNDFTTGNGSEAALFRVQVQPTQAGLAGLLAHESICGFNDSEDPWNQRSVDLSSYVGRTVILEFGLTNRLSSLMSFRLDNVRLDVTPTAPIYELYLGTNANLGFPQRVFRSTENSYTATGLLPGTTYFWRVDEVVGTRRAASPVRRFQTQAGVLPPTPPVLLGRRTGDGLHQLVFMAERGRNYRVQRSLRLDSPVWENFGDAFVGDGVDAQVTLPSDELEPVFFRVVAD